MAHFPYLIIGGGMTGAAAAHGIRELDEAGAIGLISVESEPPYDRPYRRSCGRASGPSSRPSSPCLAACGRIWGSGWSNWMPGAGA